MTVAVTFCILVERGKKNQHCWHPKTHHKNKVSYWFNNVKDLHCVNHCALYNESVKDVKGKEAML